MDLVLYICKLFYEKGLELSPIRLIKLVYLADWEYAQRHGKTYTGFKWIMGYFGPHANEIEKIIEPFIQIKTVDGLSIRNIVYSENISPDKEIKEIAQTVFKQWLNEPLPELLDYIYATLPVQTIQRQGDLLDLTKTI